MIDEMIAEQERHELNQFRDLCQRKLRSSYDVSYKDAYEVFMILASLSMTVLKVKAAIRRGGENAKFYKVMLRECYAHVSRLEKTQEVKSNAHVKESMKPMFREAYFNSNRFFVHIMIGFFVVLSLIVLLGANSGQSPESLDIPDAFEDVRDLEDMSKLDMVRFLLSN
jgi:hypothetical protein